METHIHVHPCSGGHSLESLIIQKFKEMKDELVKLEAEVKETTDLQQSAITLLQGLSQQIKDAGTDAAKLGEITDALDSKNKEFADAIAANTPAATEPTA